jgi:hypothetical protein
MRIYSQVKLGVKPESTDPLHPGRRGGAAVFAAPPGWPPRHGQKA